MLYNLAIAAQLLGTTVTAVIRRIARYQIEMEILENDRKRV